MGKVVKNFLYNSMYQVLVVIIPIILMPYLSRVLGTEAIGIYSYTISVVTLFSTFGMLGINTYSNREIAYSYAKGKDELSRTFFSLCSLRMIMMLICLCVYCIMMYFAEYKVFFALQLLLLLFNFFDLSWFFVGIQEMKVVAVRNCIVKILATILIFILVKDSKDLGLYIVINGGSLLIGAIIIFPSVKKYIQFCSIQKKDLTRHIVPIIKLFLPQAASSIYVLLDKTMIKWLTDDVVGVGFYDQSQNIAKMPLILATSLTTVMMPRISYEYMRKNMDGARKCLETAMEILGKMAYPLMFGLIGVAPCFIPWFLGDDFSPCVRILQVLTIIILPISLTNVTGVQYLTAFNKTKELTLSYTCAALINMVLNMILIPVYGVYGAATGTICAEFVVLLIQYQYMKREFGSMRILQKSVKSMIASLIMCIVIIYAGTKLSPSVQTTIIQVFMGVGIYVLCMIAFRDKIVKDVFGLIKNFRIKTMEKTDE